VPSLEFRVPQLLLRQEKQNHFTNEDRTRLLKTNIAFLQEYTFNELQRSIKSVTLLACLIDILLISLACPTIGLMAVLSVLFQLGHIFTPLPRAG
jgi:hypothetical protein